MVNEPPEPEFGPDREPDAREPEPESQPGSERPPLLQVGGIRFLIAMSLVLAILGVGLIAVAYVLADGVVWPLAIALVLLACMPWAVGAIDRGRWTAGRWGRIEQVSVAAIGLAIAGFGLWMLADGVDALLERDVVGTETWELTALFALATVALGGATAILISVPLPLGRRGVLALFAGAAVTVAGCGVAAAAVYAGPDGCDDFHVERERWLEAVAERDHNDDAEDIGAAIERCRTLDGLDRAQIRELLGRPEVSRRRGEEWAWQVGWTAGFISRGGTLELRIGFAGDTVESMYVSDGYH